MGLYNNQTSGERTKKNTDVEFLLALRAFWYKVPDRRHLVFTFFFFLNQAGDGEKEKLLKKKKK